MKKVSYELGPGLDADKIAALLGPENFSSYAGKPPNTDVTSFYRGNHVPVLQVTGNRAEIINEHGTKGLEEDIETVRKILGMI